MAENDAREAAQEHDTHAGGLAANRPGDKCKAPADCIKGIFAEAGS